MRHCIDGSSDKCKDSEKERKISCNLRDCPKILGDWTNVDECKAYGTDPTCGSGNQTQTRLCVDGTNDKCTESDGIRIVSCNLPDCPKVLGQWTNTGSCESDNSERSCGPGSQYQTRSCIDGTTDKCSKSDTTRLNFCRLPDCPKFFGNWTTSGNCESIGDYEKCGKGKAKETRECFDGTSDICSTVDTVRYIECNLPNCFTDIGAWKNVGNCHAINNKRSCGPGIQKQTRTCTDGVLSKCTLADRSRSITCNLLDCQKHLGNWSNDGHCTPLKTNTNCGPGLQTQIRSCVDGTIEKCTGNDTTQTIPCSLPDCPKRLGRWSNVKYCNAVQSGKSCGPGRQFQRRICEDGTNDKCRPQDMERSIFCSLIDCPKKVGNWSSVGSCVAVGPDQSCGPGNQNQNRDCVDGTKDRCKSSDRQRTISCNKEDCPKILGVWINDGPCHPTESDGKQCRPSKQAQVRTCVHGTKDKCRSGLVTHND